MRRPIAGRRGEIVERSRDRGWDRILFPRCIRPCDIVDGVGPIALARANLDPFTFDVDLDLVELPIGRRLRRAVAEQVVRARVANDLLHAGSKIVAVDDRPAVGIGREHLERVLRLAQAVGVLREHDSFFDAILEHRQAARIDRIDRRVLPRHRREHLLHLVDQVGVGNHLISGGGLRRVAAPAAVRIAQAGLGGNRIGHLRRQDAGESFTDEDDRLAAFSQRAQLHRRTLEGIHRDLVADALDGLCRVHRILLFELVARPVVELAPFELVDGGNRRVPIAAEPQIGDRRQRIHERHHVGRSQLVLDEFDEWLLDREVVAALDVVVIQQNDEQTNIGTRGLALFVVVVANRPRRSAFHRFQRIELDDLERIDLLGLAVFGHGKIVLREIHHRLAVFVGDDDINADVVDASANRRRRLLLVGLLGRLGRRRRSGLPGGLLLP